MSRTPSHQRRDVWPTNCTHKDSHASIFFYTSGTSHARYIHTRFNFEVGHFTCHFLLLSFFLLVLLWKEFNSHSFIVTFHFSHLSGSPPVFYPAEDDCWIHVNLAVLPAYTAHESLSLWMTDPGWLIGDSSLWVLPFNFTTPPPDLMIT